MTDVIFTQFCVLLSARTTERHHHLSFSLKYSLVRHKGKADTGLLGCSVSQATSTCCVVSAVLPEARVIRYRLEMQAPDIRYISSPLVWRRVRLGLRVCSTGIHLSESEPNYGPLPWRTNVKLLFLSARPSSEVQKFYFTYKLSYLVFPDALFQFPRVEWRDD